jgi:N-acylglucosamine 2-epimerase
MNFSDLALQYRRTLLQDIIPFWTRFALDSDGCLNTCISDVGQVISRDRWGWSQWRAVWVFSRLYNQIERRAEWLRLAEGICGFMTDHGPLANGHWPLLLNSEGEVIRGFESVYTDGFAIYGLVELWRATRKPQLLELALQTFRATEAALNRQIPPPAWPYPIAPNCWAHGISMIFSIVYHELAEVTRSSEVRSAALVHHQRVMQTFLRQDRGLVLERLYQDGTEMPSPEGTVVLPGHAIESLWMQMHIARVNGDSATLARAVKAIRRHLEVGWDCIYGGLLLAVDANGGQQVAWPFAETKLWWPHTEALYSTLLAFEHCRESWCLEWHERIRDYSFAHYPVADHGEWRQKLDRLGRPIAEVIALPVKDPFHLPRALLYCLEVLDRLTELPKP